MWETFSTSMTPVWCEQALFSHQITPTSGSNKHHMTLNIILLNQQRFMGLSGLVAAGPPDPEHASKIQWNDPTKGVCVLVSAQSYYQKLKYFKGNRINTSLSVISSSLRLQCVSLTRRQVALFFLGLERNSSALLIQRVVPGVEFLESKSSG